MNLLTSQTLISIYAFSFLLPYFACYNGWEKVLFGQGLRETETKRLSPLRDKIS